MDSSVKCSWKIPHTYCQVLKETELFYTVPFLEEISQKDHTLVLLLLKTIPERD